MKLSKSLVLPVLTAFSLFSADYGRENPEMKRSMSTFSTNDVAADYGRENPEMMRMRELGMSTFSANHAAKLLKRLFEGSEPVSPGFVGVSLTKKETSASSQGDSCDELPSEPESILSTEDAPPSNESVENEAPILYDGEDIGHARDIY